ncbi:MAG: tyrosine-type recombinase/integrase [Proteobacteria bacterium]|nr:tyrosine-type recombinase/integrase [Pseudomonadota bacterium]
MAKGKKTQDRIYGRHQGGVTRWYGDFRNIGGGREALVVPGDTRATTDRVVAEKLVADRLVALQEQKRNGVLTGVERSVTLGEFAPLHLVQKAKSGQCTESWLESSQRMLAAAIKFFGAGKILTSIGVADVEAYMEELRSQPNRRGGTLGAGSVRHHLNVLSNLFEYAESKKAVPVGFNPVAATPGKPEAASEEAHWLEIHEAAMLLEAARTYTPKGSARHGLPFIYPLLATFLLTGGRDSEVTGLEVGDVNLDRKIITFRPNAWRRLKTKGSHRSVPLWPQLEAILRTYMRGGDAPRVGGLLFPSPKLLRYGWDKTGRAPGTVGMITDFRGALDAVAALAGWKEGEVRTKAFRHTYCAARLQTLDNGFPVSEFVVKRELGHAAGSKLVEKVYGHLGEIRHRSEAVEYRVEQHQEKIKERAEQIAATPMLRLA